jgi:hypothetical protein
VTKNISFIVFLVLLTTLCGVTWFYTGKFAPPSGDASLWFYGGLFALLAAKFVTEYRFTRPNDVIVNCLAAFVAISTLNDPPLEHWWELLRWCILACGSAALVLAWDPGREARVASSVWKTIIYRLVTRLGSAEVLFSVVFVLALVSFLDSASASTQAFALVWGSILLAANMNLGSLTAAAVSARHFRGRQLLGSVHAFLSPSIVYCRKAVAGSLAPHELVGFSRSMRTPPHCFGVVIDERASAAETLVSVALLDTSVGEACLTEQSLMVKLSADDVELAKARLQDDPIDLTAVAGTVSPGTNIAQLRFEVFGAPKIASGSLLASQSAGSNVFYQVFGGAITEEATLRGSDRAYVVGEAEQVGFWDPHRGGFGTHDWVARERGLVRLVDENFAPPVYHLKPTEYRIGNIPGSLFPANVSLNDLVLYHTGILGVTGSGKSFLAYDLIEQCAASGVKVVCVDPTGDYQRHLQEAVMVPGTAHLKAFLHSPDHRVCILETSAGGKHPIEQAQLVAEACLTWCEGDRTDEDVLHPRPKVLVVFEEAHLLVPEWNFNPERRLQDVVSKTSQIVLQARKFGLGFLVISQRTANVVKSILNQCNTIVSFQAFDETGFDFLKNYMGTYHVKSLPNLKARHGILVGKASLSRRPLMVRFRDQQRHLNNVPAGTMPLPEQQPAAGA